MSGTKNEHGEGNYKASKQYNDATKKFVESGRVDEAARDAQPDTEAEALDMANAEAKGKARAKEEDPALLRRSGAADPSDPKGKPATDRSADQTNPPKPGQDKG